MARTRRHRLGVQAWVSPGPDDVPSADLITPVQGSPDAPSGGFWTSNWDQRRGSRFVEWCRTSDWGARPFTIWLLDPHRAARVRVIHDDRDVAKLFGDGPVDWLALARNLDAVHLSDRGHRRTRLWLCESTLWFRWSFTRVRRAP